MKYPNGKPQFKNNKHMMIGAYWCPIPTDKAYKEMYECGITHVIVNTMIGHEKEDEGYYKLPFKFAQKHNLKILMHCMMQDGYGNIKQYTEIFKNASTYDGVYAKDEPNIKEYDAYAADYQDYKKIFPDKAYIINLFPDYASESQLGTKNYEEYINDYRTKILEKYDADNRVLMCDCYPLKINREIYPKWLKNIEQLRQICDETNSDLYLHIQSQGFCTFWRQPVKVAELTYQMYVYLAYGVKGISHYPYRMPQGSLPHEKSCVTYHNRKTYMYYMVQQMNALLNKIDGIYLDFNHKAVVKSAGFLNEKENANFVNCNNLKNEYGILKSVKSNYDAIVGCFENKDGYQGFMAVNFNEPLEDKINEVELEFGCEVNKAEAIIRGEPKTLNIKDGKLKLKLEAGEGVFVVPYKE